MNKLIFGASLAALALATPAIVQAQALPAVTIAIIDTNRVGRTCTACAAALTQLQAQDTALEQRRTQLATPLQTEANAIDTALRALPQGTQPDAAMQQRVQTFQQQQRAAETEIQGRGQTLQRNLAFVQQQIAQRVIPAAQQVGQQRGAGLVLDRGQVVHLLNPAIDISDAVLALVNQNTTPFNVNAPPPQQAPAGQTPAQQPQQPRPQGR
ncbi:MAG: OmpH family outer membrane protein [Allosphingosinicella sp.]